MPSTSRRIRGLTFQPSVHRRRVVFAWLRSVLELVADLVAFATEALDLEGLEEVFGKPSWMLSKKGCDGDCVTPDLGNSLEADLFTFEIIRSHIQCGW